MKRSSKQSKSHKQNWITFPAGIWPRHTWTRSPTAQSEFGYKWNTAIASSSSRVVVNHFNPAISLLLRLAGWSGTLTELRPSLFRPLPCRSRLTEWPAKVLVTSPLNSFNSTQTIRWILLNGEAGLWSFRPQTISSNTVSRKDSRLVQYNLVFINFFPSSFS